MPAQKHISELLSVPGFHASFEFFPPKSPTPDALYATAQTLGAYGPDFCSVTWGAGGSTARNTLDIVSQISQRLNVTAVPHFTGLGMMPETVNGYLAEMKALGIRNVLVLRGDIPHGMKAGDAFPGGFRYATEMVRHIRRQPGCSESDLGILVAGCPEGHPEAESFEKDMDYLAEKVRAGAQQIVTQFFFDNSKFYQFVDALQKRKVHVPVSVGLMIITRSAMIQKMLSLSSNTVVPDSIRAAIDRYADDDKSMEAFGVDYAVRQIRDLRAHGIQNVHFYTLNRAEPTAAVLSALDLLGKPTAAATGAKTAYIPYREYCAFPDASLGDLFRHYGIDPNRPHSVVYNHTLRRYEVSQ